ncbi:hypothetical protein WMY93_031637 [Mugilogobius chulae]|uniref:Myb-like domain-containing protein n=1 Tax=Mugilogobius chulae TaxID=88201 RepID=A0AAW0MDS9_9GOBI
MVKFPGGSPGRWERIAHELNRTVAQVTAKVKQVKENVSHTPSGLVKLSELKATPPVTSLPADDDITQREGVASDEEEGRSLCRGGGAKAKPEVDNQQRLLELALQQFPRGTNERWTRISAVVPGKSKDECMSRYKTLAELVQKRKQAKTSCEAKTLNLYTSFLRRESATASNSSPPGQQRVRNSQNSSPAWTGGAGTQSEQLPRLDRRGNTVRTAPRLDRRGNTVRTAPPSGQQRKHSQNSSPVWTTEETQSEQLPSGQERKHTKHRSEQLPAWTGGEHSQNSSPAGQREKHSQNSSPAWTGEETQSEQLPVWTTEETQSEQLPVWTTEETQSEQLPRLDTEETQSEQLPVWTGEETQSEQLPRLDNRGNTNQNSSVWTTEEHSQNSSPVWTGEETQSEQLPAWTGEETQSEQLPRLDRRRNTVRTAPRLDRRGNNKTQSEQLPVWTGGNTVSVK